MHNSYEKYLVHIKLMLQFEKHFRILKSGLMSHSNIQKVDRHLQKSKLIQTTTISILKKENQLHWRKSVSQN